MTRISSTLSAFFILALLTCQLTFTACKKESVVQVYSKDSVLSTDANNWTMFNQANNSILSPGPSTFTSTSEGIKFFTQTARTGVRLQSKTEASIVGKSLYYKWKANGQGQFAAYVLSLKYDPTTPDGSAPPIEAVEFSTFSTNNTYAGSTLIQNDTWYYTRVYPSSGLDNYTAVTCTNNYDNKGGTVLVSTTVPVYTKHGYVSIRIGDSYASNSYGVLGECKIDN